VAVGCSETDSECFIAVLGQFPPRIHPRVKTYTICLQPYAYFIASDGGEGITMISGWSKAFLKYEEFHRRNRRIRAQCWIGLPAFLCRPTSDAKPRPCLPMPISPRESLGWRDSKP
jgi:hypothetical protein